jgi:transcriptional regulator with XRE-family HTH domain
MESLLTNDDWLQKTGASIRALRLEANISQAQLSKQAGISESALKNLEGGHGATMTTFIRVLRALRRESWLDTLKPAPVINPLLIARDGSQRQRAPRRKKPDGAPPKV